MFASRVKKTIEVNDGTDKGSVVIRKLSARSLERAREARQMSAAKLTTSFGPDMIKAFRETNKEVAAAPVVAGSKEARETTYASYDRDTVLTQGVESWTFKENLVDGLNDLDEPIAEMLFHAIIDLSDPPKAEVEKLEKNA